MVNIISQTPFSPNLILISIHPTGLSHTIPSPFSTTPLKPSKRNPSNPAVPPYSQPLNQRLKTLPELMTPTRSLRLVTAHVLVQRAGTDAPVQGSSMNFPGMISKYSFKAICVSEFKGLDLRG